MVVLFKILGSNPTSLGNGLNKVKKVLSVCGENLSKTPGEHIYKTINGDYIKMHLGGRITRVRHDSESWRKVSESILDKLG